MKDPPTAVTEQINDETNNKIDDLGQTDSGDDNVSSLGLFLFET